jgi:hypothetical protein
MLSTNKIASIHWSLDLGPSSKVALSFTTSFSIIYLECTHIYLCTSDFFFFLFFFNFVVCKFCQNFPFFEHFFSLEFTLLKRVFSISSKNICSHSAKSHQEKSLLCTEFLLFFHSEIICYDRPCNFSFSPQAPPIIATDQGEPAPTLVHSAS